MNNMEVDVTEKNYPINSHHTQLLKSNTNGRLINDIKEGKSEGFEGE